MGAWIAWSRPCWTDRANGNSRFQWPYRGHWQHGACGSRWGHWAGWFSRSVWCNRSNRFFWCDGCWFNRTDGVNWP